MHLVEQKSHELDVFGKRGISLVSGRGAHLFDAEGRRYIDCVGGHGAANIGHGHPRLALALAEQAGRLIQCPGAFDNPVRSAYQAELTAVAPPGLDRVFLCNSGAEAVESALKFARLTTGRPGILAARRGFHGRTFGAMTATFNPNYSRGCEPLLPGIRHVNYNNIEALDLQLDESCAAVLLEVVQGEGGVRPADDDYLRAVRELCDSRGALLILDEVQTGFGRTGRMFACQHADVRPDMLCLAKAIAGGMPMGAVLVNERVECPIGKHGTTFGGNPLACAAARTTLRILIEEDLVAAAARKGAYLFEALHGLRHPAIKEVRGRGLMVGIECDVKVKPLLDRLAQEGVLALNAGPTVLRLLPPLVIGQGDLDRVVSAIDKVLAEL